MLIATLEAPGLKKTLGKLMEQLQNQLPLFKTWGRAVELKAKTNARNYGGRRIWRNIAGATRLLACPPRATCKPRTISVL